MNSLMSYMKEAGTDSWISRCWYIHQLCLLMRTLLREVFCSSQSIIGYLSMACNPETLFPGFPVAFLQPVILQISDISPLLFNFLFGKKSDILRRNSFEDISGSEKVNYGSLFFIGLFLPDSPQEFQCIAANRKESLVKCRGVTFQWIGIPSREE